MRAFDIVHVATSALAAFIPLLMILNDKDDLESLGLAGLCALALAAGAAIAGWFCRWWPGLAASWWRLWLAAWLFNPVVLLGLLFIASQHDCLFGQVRGWGCMGLALVVLASPMTLIGPTIAVVVHVVARRSQADSTTGAMSP
ncbi:MAG: hypothetical protein AB7O88_10700 [Reyranellaceae bacterium]